MKLITSIFLIALLSFTTCLYFPWWSIAIVAFAVTALLRQAPLPAFITGFTSLFLLWGILSFWISKNNHNILAHKVSVLILKTDNPFLLVFATALIGALVAGFAALAGAYTRGSTSPKA